FFSGDVQNMKSATNVVPTFQLSSFALLHIGPSPIMTSAVSDKVKGFRNTTSVSNSESLPRNSFALPTSTSSQSLIKSNSLENDGPLLKASCVGHSPAAPIMATQSGSLSFSAAVAPWADAINAVARLRAAKFLFITPSNLQKAKLKQSAKF